MLSRLKFYLTGMLLAGVNLGVVLAEEPSATKSDEKTVIILSKDEPKVPDASPDVKKANAADPVTTADVKSGNLTCETAPHVTIDEPKSHFEAGVGLYILRPYAADPTAYILNTGIGTTRPRTDFRNFSWNYDNAPVIYANWQSASGWGVRSRYLQFQGYTSDLSTTLNAGEALTTTISPPANLQFAAGTPTFTSPGVSLLGGFGQDNLSFRGELDVKQIDLEGSVEFLGQRSSLLITVGGRYLYTEQNYFATSRNTTIGGGGVEVSRLEYSQDFNGGGPLFGLTGNYQLIPNCFSAFGTARGALLVGTTNTRNSYNFNLVDPAGLAGGSQTTSNLAVSQRYTQVPMAEIEAGLEYTLKFGDVYTVLRGGVFNQQYFGIGGTSSTNSNMSLFGVFFNLGIGF